MSSGTLTTVAPQPHARAIAAWSTGAKWQALVQGPNGIASACLWKPSTPFFSTITTTDTQLRTIGAAAPQVDVLEDLTKSVDRDRSMDHEAQRLVGATDLGWIDADMDVARARRDLAPTVCSILVGARSDRLALKASGSDGTRMAAGGPFWVVTTAILLKTRSKSSAMAPPIFSCR